MKICGITQVINGGDMGYRNYFYLVPKKVVQDIQQLETEESFYEYVSKSRYLSKEARKEARKELKTYRKDPDDCYLGLYKIGKEVFEFGKLYWDDTAEQIENTGTKLFKEKTELAERYEDYGAYVVGKEAVLKAIEIYHNKTKTYFEDLLLSADELQKKHGWWNGIEDIGERCKDAVQSKVREWGNRWNIKPYDLEDNKYSIVNSWLYEYEIFELVHILKTIDWNKYDLIFMGW